MGVLKLAFLNVGQGDTAIIYDPDNKEAVVGDCLDYRLALRFLEGNEIVRLRALILTHPHIDHYLGAIKLLDGCETRGITWDACVFRWDRSYTKMPELLRDSDGHSDIIDGKRRKSHYQALVSWAIRPSNKARHLADHELVRDSRIIRSLEFLHPKHRDLDELFRTGSLNNLSYVVRVSDGKASALLTGDIEPAGWGYLKENHPESLANAVLKFPHHGVWRGGQVTQLLDEVTPQIVVISVGTENTYGHPATEVFAEIRRRKGVRLLCTQATTQCCQDIPHSCGPISDLMEQEDIIWASMSNHRDSSGCPCAGTVIIELGRTARVIRPSAKFHIGQIIELHMKHTHQCPV